MQPRFEEGPAFAPLAEPSARQSDDRLDHAQASQTQHNETPQSDAFQTSWGTFQEPQIHGTAQAPEVNAQTPPYQGERVLEPPHGEREQTVQQRFQEVPRDAGQKEGRDHAQTPHAIEQPAADPSCTTTPQSGALPFRPSREEASEPVSQTSVFVEPHVMQENPLSPSPVTHQPTLGHPEQSVSDARESDVYGGMPAPGTVPSHTGSVTNASPEHTLSTQTLGIEQPVTSQTQQSDTLPSSPTKVESAKPAAQPAVSERGQTDALTDDSALPQKGVPEESSVTGNTMELGESESPGLTVEFRQARKILPLHLGRKKKNHQEKE
ncbi:MAG: hypothetical protein IJU76_05750 [Desulfovibrionaceae bacterium]|nr:hypothetical protein [Desulfovibrionaceae bacterium]